MAQGRRVGTIPLTAIPLGIGGGLILVVALVTEGAPRIPLAGWGVIVGLAVVNTALAYLLYTHALRHLTATEANVILNLTPAGTAVIAWVSLGERLLPVQIGAMAAVVAGVVLVQWRKGNRYGQAHPLASSRSS